MHHFFEAITNTSGESLVGYYGRVIDPGTLGTVTLSSDDNGTPIITVSGVANMGVTDDYGNLSFYVEPGTYHLDIYAADSTTFVYRVPNVAMNSAKGDTGAPGATGDVGPSDATFLSLASLKAINPAVYPSPRLAAMAGSDGGVINGPFTYQLGSFTGRTDVVFLNSDPTGAMGALVRQGAKSVTFQQRGVAAKPIDTEAKLRQVEISITDGFGADPTALDNRAAIQAALDAGGPGSRVRVPNLGGGSTIWKVDQTASPLKLYPGQTLSGDGWSTATGAYGPYSGSIIQATGNGRLVEIKGTSGAVNERTTIENLFLWCATKNSNATGLYYELGRYHRVSNVNTTNFGKGMHGVDLNWQMDTNRFQAFGCDWGMYFDAGGSEDSTHRNTVIRGYSPTAIGVGLNYTCQNITFVNPDVGNNLIDFDLNNGSFAGQPLLMSATVIGAQCELNRSNEEGANGCVVRIRSANSTGPIGYPSFRWVSGRALAYGTPNLMTPIFRLEKAGTVVVENLVGGGFDNLFYGTDTTQIGQVVSMFNGQYEWRDKRDADASAIGQDFENYILFEQGARSRVGPLAKVTTANVRVTVAANTPTLIADLIGISGDGVAAKSGKFLFYGGVEGNPNFEHAFEVTGRGGLPDSIIKSITETMGSVGDRITLTATGAQIFASCTDAGTLIFSIVRVR